MYKSYHHLRRLFIAYPIAFILMGFAFSLCLDKKITSEVATAEHSSLRHYAGLLTDAALGSYWITCCIALFAFLSLYIQLYPPKHEMEWSKNFRRWSAHLILAILSTGLLVMILKFLVGRERPHIEHGFPVFTAIPFSLNAFYQSFPSGHTQVIFCVGTMLSYLWPRWRYGFMALAFALAMTRVLTLNHFISDVYVGALFGTFGCVFSVNFWGQWLEKPKALRRSSPSSS